MSSSSKVRVWVEGAIVAAVAMALSFIPLGSAAGFSISIGMIPVTIYSFRRGVQAGIFSGFVWGLLHILLGTASILTLYQGFIEYIVAFAAAGFAGLYSRKIQQAIRENSSKTWLYLLLGTFLGTLIRYVFHFYAGVVFWGEYAAWGLGPVAYSLVINGTNGLLTAAATYVVILIIAKKKSDLFLT